MRIKTQITIAIGSFLVITISIIYFMYVQTSQIVISNNDTFTEDIISNYNLEIAQSNDEISQMMVSLSFDPIIQKFMTQTDLISSYNMMKDLDRKIISLKAGRKGIEDIIIVGTGGAKYSLNGGIDNIKEYEEEIVNSNDIYVSGLQKFNYNLTETDDIFFAQNVFSNNTSDGTIGSNIGYIAIVVNVAALYFDKDKANHTSGVQFYLIDRIGNVFPNHHASDITQIMRDPKLIDGEERQGRYNVGGAVGSVQIHQSDLMQASTLSFIEEDKLLTELSHVRFQSMMIVLVAALLMVIPFAIIIKSIIQPMGKLLRFIKSIKRGNLDNLDTQLELKGSIEMRVVAEELNGMLAEINRLTQQLVETTTNLMASEIEKEKAASAYLRSQINPHFLYNTLESIRGIAYEEGATRIVDMIKALGKLFHYSIKGSGHVSLEQELNAVKSYVFLQRMRFEDRFDVTYSFTEAALNVTVMKMILQPLVENAIYHGLEPLTTKGHLTITGEITREDVLVISIIDDGLGVESDRVADIQRKLDGFTTDVIQEGRYRNDQDSIGLYNVNNRIKLAYGSLYGMTFNSQLGQGTHITLTIPVNHFNSEEAKDV